MKNIYIKLNSWLLVIAFLLASSCSDDVLDKIDTNPNSPTDVPINLLLPQAIVDVTVGVAGNELAWYSSVFVEHTTGVHAQLQDADRRSNITTGSFTNSWEAVYADALKDLSIIIEKGSTGSEAGKWEAVGMAKVLYAFTLGIATDLWGRVPNTQALMGSENRKPEFDSQQEIYVFLQTLLDEAIADFDKPSLGSFANVDFLYGGDTELWKKAAWGLKARFHNRLSKIDPAGSATAALAAAANSFTAPEESMIFNAFEAVATGEHPWYQEFNDRKHHAVSQTFYNILNGLNDPRSDIFFTKINGEVVPAPNGTSVNDQAGTIFSKASPNVVYATAPLPLLTYDEVKFIEAEANLRLGNMAAANAAYEAAVTSSLERAGVAPDAISAYVAQATVFPGEANLTLQNIITQKYISFWLFQPIEAYNDFRRTGIPTLNNLVSQPPRRFPYSQEEIDTNQENVPTGINIFSSGVWWDDGTED